MLIHNYHHGKPRVLASGFDDFVAASSHVRNHLASEPTKQLQARAKKLAAGGTRRFGHGFSSRADDASDGVTP